MSAASIALTIDLFGVNVALPTMAHDLGLGPTALQWVPGVYFLTLAAPLVAAGRIGDVFGRRRVLLAGTLLFGIGALAAALAPDAAVLLLARALSGVGAALVTALSLTIVSESFGPDRRGFAIGLWSGVGAFGAAAGPLVGGVVTETLGWRWLFALDVPVVIATAIVTWLVVPESRDNSAHRVGAGSVAAVTAALGLLAFGLLQAQDSGWASPWVLVPLVLAAPFFAVFVAAERRSREPVVDLEWLLHPPAAGSAVVAFVGNAAFAIVMLYLTLYFQDVRHDGTILTGVAFLAFTIPLGIGSPIVGKLTGRVAAPVTLAVGCVVLAAGAGVMATMRADTTLLVPCAGLALSGIGQAVVFNATNVAAVSSVDAEREGMAAGVVSGVRQMGSLLGLAVAGVAFSSAGGALGAGAVSPDLFVDGLHAAMAVTAGAAVLGLVASGWARSARPVSRPTQ
jgi:EmrB/QacA subfamily drug resistance transporter